MVFLFRAMAILAVACLGPVSARGGDVGRKPAVYKNWPACKRNVEYVLVVKKDDRVPGEVYHERDRRGGNSPKTYLCQPCTECASGVREDQPCSVYHDTVCSATECAVPGCILDENFYACRLPGDPNDFSSIAAMLDPCDPRKATVTPSLSGDERQDQTREPPQVQVVHIDNSLSKDGGQVNDGPEKGAETGQSVAGKQGGWGTLETSLLSGLVILVIVLANVTGIFVYCRSRRSRKGQSGRDCSSAEEKSRMMTSEHGPSPAHQVETAV